MTFYVLLWFFKFPYIFTMQYINICVTPPKGGENRKTSESINSKTTRNMHSIIQTSKYPNIPMLCINDELPEMRHLDQDFKGFGARGQRCRGVPWGRLELGAEVVAAAWFPGVVDRRPPVGGLCAGWDKGSLDHLSELITYTVSNDGVLDNPASLARSGIGVDNL